MQRLIIQILGTAISFAVTRTLIGGFALGNTLSTYFFASILFLLVNLVLTPLLKLIFLPINLLTLGLFRWLINILVLYLFDLAYAGLTISAYTFPGFSSPLLTLPAVYLSLFWVLFFSSLIMSLTYSLFTSLFHE